MKKTVTGLVLSLAAALVQANPLPSDLSVTYDENIKFTKNCPENWYLVQQVKPIFANGMPPYRAISSIGISRAGVDVASYNIENLPTDFGSYSKSTLTKHSYISDIIPVENMVVTASVDLGTIVASKHAALEGNTRKQCVYAEHIEITGYQTVEVNGIGRYQKPEILIRRFIGEVAVDKRNTAYVTLGKDNVVEASLFVDIKEFR